MLSFLYRYVKIAAIQLVLFFKLTSTPKETKNLSGLIFYLLSLQKKIDFQSLNLCQ